jgi:hypothetical protein
MEWWDDKIHYSSTPLLHHPTFSRCGMNIVKHLQAPPALRNSLIGNGWQV